MFFSYKRLPFQQINPARLLSTHQHHQPCPSEGRLSEEEPTIHHRAAGVRDIPGIGSVVNNHGDRKSTKDVVIPLINGRFIAYKWG